MTTTSTPGLLSHPLPPTPSVETLELAYRQAAADAERIWKIQCHTTLDEGYDWEQAHAAIAQAQAAQAQADRAYARWCHALQVQAKNEALADFPAQPDEDGEEGIDYTPLGGW